MVARKGAFYTQQLYSDELPKDVRRWTSLCTFPGPLINPYCSLVVCSNAHPTDDEIVPLLNDDLVAQLTPLIQLCISPGVPIVHPVSIYLYAVEYFYSPRFLPLNTFYLGYYLNSRYVVYTLVSFIGLEHCPFVFDIVARCSSRFRCISRSWATCYISSSGSRFLRSMFDDFHTQ